jgi:hypothetical protein
MALGASPWNITTTSLDRDDGVNELGLPALATR